MSQHSDRYDLRLAPSPEAELELLFDVFWHGATAIRVPQRQSLLDVLNSIIDRIIALESRPSTMAEPSAVAPPQSKEFRQPEPAIAAPAPPDSSMRERAERWATRMIRDDTVVGSHHEKLQWLSAGGQGEVSTRSRREYIADALIAFASAEGEKLNTAHMNAEAAMGSDIIHKQRKIDGLECRIDDLVLKLGTFTAERDALKAAILWALGGEGSNFRTRAEGEGAYWWRTELRRRAGMSAESSAPTPPPTQGDEGFEAWAKRRWSELVVANQAYSWATIAEQFAREAHHRATNAERQRCAKIAHDESQPLMPARGIAWRIENAIVNPTPSEQSK